MNKDRVKGTIDDVAGRAKRQVGEWTGDTNAQLEGLGQQVKGKAEKAFGTAKDAVREGHEQMKEKVEKAWESTKDSVREGKEQVKGQAKKAWQDTGDAGVNGREEEHQRQEADQMRDQGDLDPVYQSGARKGVQAQGPLVTEKPRSAQR
jgi:uncharacterized protein YjbJ (UPF0337 family)